MTDVSDRPFTTKVKETNAPARTEWLTADSAQWSKTDEALNPDIWSVLSTPVSKRRSVARDFASAMSAKSEVVEVWVTEVENDLSVAITLQGSAAEIEIRTTFLDLVMERLDPQEGELHVFPDGDVPDWVKRGEQLI